MSLERRSRPGEIPEESLRELVDGGFRIRDIAEYYGLNRAHIDYLLKRHNIRVPRGRDNLSRETLEIRRNRVIGAEITGQLAKLTPSEQKTLQLLYPDKGGFPILDKAAEEIGVSRKMVEVWDDKGLAKLDILFSGGELRKPGRPKKVIPELAEG